MSAVDAFGRAWRSNGGPLVFVWGTWLALSISLLGFVRTHTVDVPYFDEWELVPAIAGEQPITLKWLWSLHNEHRIFIPRLIYLALQRAGGDFRTGALLDACVLAAAAAGLLAVARRLRGRAAYSDAFFPLVLLNWGQTQNLVWSFQMQFVGSSVLAIAALLLLVRPGPMTLRTAMALATCTILLPLLGGNGVALVPALALCVLLAGWDVHNAETLRAARRAVAVWALGLLALALLAFYFVGYQRPAKHPPSHSLGATVEGAVQFLTMGLGAAVKPYWPMTKYALVFGLGGTVVALLVTAVSRSRRSSVALRLVLFLGSLCSLALGLAWARSALSPNAMFASRYATLAAPLYCGMYLAWGLVDRPTLGRLAQVILFFSSALLFIPNREHGLQEGPPYRDLRASVVADLHAGVPLGELVQRHYRQLYYGGPDVLAERMRMLHAHGIGVFKELRE